MDYKTAWDKSSGWIYYYWRKWKPNCVDFDDYYQECALYFWGKLKPRFDAEKCWVYSKVAFKRVVIKLVYRNKQVPCVCIDDFFYGVEDAFDFWEVELKPHLKKVALLIADGYETDEICKITGKTRQTIYTDIKNIKKIYAGYFGIKDYQRKHLRKFTRKRTEKELLSWENSKVRLRAVQESRKKERCLPMSEKLSQCVI